MTNGSPYADWVGRVVEGEDSAPPQAAAALAATLDLDAEARAAADIGPEGLLPPLWHWLAFLDDAPLSALREDGAPERNALLPPAGSGRRRLAGGRLRFHGELRIGETLHRRSEVVSAAGRPGGGALVTIAHEISTSRGLAVSETQELLFLPGPDEEPAPAPPVPPAPVWRQAIAFSPVQLFRFAAATFDSQRIHYDAPYARAAGLPGLAAQGRLQAILLLEAARRRRGGAWPAAYAFRGLRPLIAEHPATLAGMAEAGGGQDLCTLQDDAVCMQARATWEA